MKDKLKKIIPKAVIRKLINPYHLAEAMIASAYYGFPARKMKFIGVTGTKGKTTTTNMIGSILEASGKRIGIASTAVIQVGEDRQENYLKLTTANAFAVQKLLKQMQKAKCEWVVLEVSSHALIQHRVWGIHFNAAVWTNLQRDHLDYHKTMDEYAAAKAKLFADYPALSVLNADDEYYDTFASLPAEQSITFGIEKKADCTVAEAKLASHGSAAVYELDGQKVDIRLHLPGKFNVINGLAAATTAYGLNVSLEDIKTGLENLKSVPGRMERIDEGQDATVIVDYAHTEESLRNVLQTVRDSLKGRLIAVVGADGERDASKRIPIGKVAAELSEVVIVTDQEPYGDDPVPIRAQVLEGAHSVKTGVVVKEIPDRTEAIAQALKYGKKGDVVMITGLGSQNYRGMKEGKVEWDDRVVVSNQIAKIAKK